MPRRSEFRVRPRIRVLRDDGVVVLGPGKADVLDQIRQHGSIREAAANLGMSYMRAWKLVRLMNEAFPTALVEKSRGGVDRGGATLTDRGVEVLERYRRMERKALAAIDKEWSELRKVFRR